MSYYFWGRGDNFVIGDSGGGRGQWGEGPLLRWWLKQGGLIKALFLALAFEMVENTETIIDLFRENSGMHK